MVSGAWSLNHTPPILLFRDQVSTPTYYVVFASLKRWETIYSALETAFSDSELPPGKCLIQVSRTIFKYARVDATDRFDLLYRQLWLIALREYRDMPNGLKKKLAGPRAGEVNEIALFEFASLANWFGFHTKEMQGLLQRDPDREMIYRFLRTAR